jgi:hypothetical protein
MAVRTGVPGGIDLPRVRTRPAIPRPHPGVAGWLALAAFAAYLSFGVWLAFVVSDIDPDTWSRVGNAYYVLFSRDPHLAAIGFVWGPLPSLLMLPLLPFAAVLPGVVTHAFAGNILSAAFMAGTVYLMWHLVERLGVPRPAAILVVLLYAANPEIVFFGANGMSEGMFLFFLLAGTLSLLAWIERGSVYHLAVLGGALGLAYLTRYEAAFAAAAAMAVVGAVSLARARGGARERAMVAIADVIIVATPFVAAFAAFAFASWIVVGHPFQTVASVYGNSSQVEVMRDILRERTGLGTGAALPFVRNQILGLQPAVPLVVTVAVVVAIWRRDARILAPLALLGGVLLFAVVAFLDGHTFGSLRFYISVIPLVAVLAALVLARTTARGEEAPATQEGPFGSDASPSPHRATPGRRGALPRVVAGVLAVVLVVSLAVAVPSSYATRLDPKLGEGRAQQGQMNVRRAEISAEVVRWLDRQNLPRGSVLLDVATGFRVMLQSRRPEQFVITPDRDFNAALANPGPHGIRYLVVPTNMVLDQLDAINQAYPALYDTGAGVGTLVFEASHPEEQWRYRVYEVNPVD